MTESRAVWVRSNTWYTLLVVRCERTHSRCNQFIDRCSTRSERSAQRATLHCARAERNYAIALRNCYTAHCCRFLMASAECAWSTQWHWRCPPRKQDTPIPYSASHVLWRRPWFVHASLSLCYFLLACESHLDLPLSNFLVWSPGDMEIDNSMYNRHFASYVQCGEEKENLIVLPT